MRLKHHPLVSPVGEHALLHSQSVHVRLCMPQVIALLSTCTYMMEMESIVAKVDLSVSIMLTAVAFKFATASYLPQIPYLTIIDKFVMASFLQLVTSVLLQSLLGALKEWWSDITEEDLMAYNKLFFAVQVRK